MKFVETHEELNALYPPPAELVLRKQIDRLERHARRFIARTPLVLIGSQDRAGNADVTPKGDRPGFVAVLDDATLAIPDRPGNNRLDTWRNVIENPAVGLIFVIPGMTETLRVNGTARLTVDDALCRRLATDGRPAAAALVVAVRQVYMHCARALHRAAIWQPDSWPDRSQMPPLGQIVRDQIASRDDAATGSETFRFG